MIPTLCTVHTCIQMQSTNSLQGEVILSLFFFDEICKINDRLQYDEFFHYIFFVSQPQNLDLKFSAFFIYFLLIIYIYLLIIYLIYIK